MVRSIGPRKTDSDHHLARFYHMETEELRIGEVGELLDAFRVYYSFAATLPKEGPDRR